VEDLLEIVWDQIFLASETCVTVGWSLVFNFSCGRSNDVVRGGKIYKCNSNGQDLGSMVKGEYYNFSLYKCSSNGAPMEEDQEDSSEENTKISDNSKKGALSTTVKGDEEMEEGMKNPPCMKIIEWHGRKCELMNHVRNIIVGRRLLLMNQGSLFWTMILVKLRLGSKF